MTSKEKLALIKETWYDVDLTDEKYIDFDEEQTFSDLEKDLERLDYYEKIKLMLKQKICVLRYVESEDCFAVRGILDENWYKLSKDLVENNIKEEVKPMPLIVKVKKQDKILRIIKDKNVDIKQLKHFIQYYTKEVSLKTYNDYHSKEELTQEEYDLFEEWLDGKD